jgi:hypothetical protein
VLQDFSFMAHWPRLGTNTRFMVLGTGAGQISLKAETLTVWRMQYVFCAKNWAFIGLILLALLGIYRAWEQTPVLWFWGRGGANIAKS